MTISAPPARARAARWAMGTRLTVAVDADEEAGAASARDAFFGEVQRLESILSAYRDDSDLSRVNLAAGGEPCAVSRHAFDAVEAALAFARLTEGLYDPTVGPLTALWKTADGAPHAAQVERARALVGRRRVELDAARAEVRLTERGMALDLGGLGKGWALDRALERARETRGLRRVAADFGGQLLFWTPEGRFAPERVGLEDPRRPGRIARLVEITESSSLSVSSQSERPGHVVDPRTGLPAAAVGAAAAAAPTAAEAEAWSTALLVAGPGAAAELARARPGVRVFFV